jgi:hypothetical protein
MTSNAPGPSAQERSQSQADPTRIEAWAGEVRVNLIRLVAIFGFYGYHLLNVYFLSDDPTVGGPFHAAVSALVLAWTSEVLFLYFFLSRRWMPPILKYLATGGDIVFVTALLVISASPASPLVSLYFLIVAAAPLRLSLRLVYVSSLGCMIAYLFYVGYYAYYLIGAERYYSDEAIRIPRTNQVILLLALGASGLLAGQIVRQSKRLIAGYPVTLDVSEE